MIVADSRERESSQCKLEGHSKITCPMLPHESTASQLGQEEAKKIGNEECKSPEKLLTWNYADFMPYV